MIRKSISFVVLILFFSLMGCAATKSPQTSAASTIESKRESVEELLKLINAESQVDSIYSQMDQVFQGMGKQLGVKPEEQELFDRYMSKVVSLMKEEMNWNKMKEPMIEIYQKHYTEKEIQDQITFYKTESGQSMLAKQPEVTKDSLKISQELVMNFLPKLQKMAAEIDAEIKAERNK